MAQVKKWLQGEQSALVFENIIMDYFYLAIFFLHKMAEKRWSTLYFEKNVSFQEDRNGLWFCLAALIWSRCWGKNRKALPTYIIGAKSKTFITRTVCEHRLFILDRLNEVNLRQLSWYCKVEKLGGNFKFSCFWNSGRLGSSFSFSTHWLRDLGPVDIFTLDLSLSICKRRVLNSMVCKVSSNFH